MRLRANLGIQNKNKPVKFDDDINIRSVKDKNGYDLFVEKYFLYHPRNRLCKGIY